MKKMTVEQIEWLITLTEDKAREMGDSPEREMLKELADELRAARLEAKEA